MPASDDDISRELLEYLEYQRSSVRSIVEGLNEDAWHTPVVASGWTVAGMVEHLGNVERHYFQEVIAGSPVELPWDEGRPPYDPEMVFTCDRPSSDVLGYYREQCDRSNQILAGISRPEIWRSLREPLATSRPPFPDPASEFWPAAASGRRSPNPGSRR